MTDAAESLAIDVVFDPTCPWCYVGKRQLERALAAHPVLRAPGATTVRWHPFFLNPSMPRGGVERGAYLAAKFGDLSRVHAYAERITASGREVGLELALERIARTPSTLDAHRVVRWAGERGPAAQDAAVEALFRAFLVEGADLEAPDTLARAAAAAGLDPDDVAARLGTDLDAEPVRAEDAAWRDRGVTAVPFFFVAGLMIPGAQDGTVFRSVLDRALARRGTGGEAAPRADGP